MGIVYLCGRDEEKIVSTHETIQGKHATRLDHFVAVCNGLQAGSQLLQQNCYKDVLQKPLYLTKLVMVSERDNWM